MPFQTMLAYVGAVIIVVGAAVMVYAPGVYYNSGLGPQLAAQVEVAPTVEAADQVADAAGGNLK